jgi:glycosyltransferase involved in cell wall biosynthesis
MLSVIIATDNSERGLVPTLAALVPGATASLVREVIIADAGSRDATAEVADIAGCRLIVSDAPLGRRLMQAAHSARSPWLMFLNPGAAPQPGWVEETARFIEEAMRQGRAEDVAAVFRVVSPSLAPASPWREAMALIAQAVGLSRRATQGLLIAKPLYLRMSRERVDASEPEADLIRRIGWRRIVTLRSGAVRG